MRDYIIITDDMLDDSYLEHYGVVGMKWHHRKAVAAAAKGNYKRMQRQLNKNINNYNQNPTPKARHEKYNTVSQKDIDRYNRKAKARKVAKVAAGVAIAAGVGYTAYKNRKSRPNYTADAQRVANETRNSFTSTRQQAQDAINNARRSNQSRSTSTNRTESNSQRHASASEAAEAVRRYQEAANRAASSLDNSSGRNSRPNYTADAQRVANETRNSFTSTRQQAQDAINNARRNAQSSSNSHASVSDTAEALRRYQEATNRAASSLDNTRSKRKRR